MGVNWVAAGWGVAEATLFFFVPDIWLSIAGRKKLRIGWVACLYCLAGALIGGCVMYAWGHCDLAGIQRMVENVPAVSLSMIERVNEDLTHRGVLAIFLGPITGTPYKVYAAHAAAAGIGLWLFLLISIPARMIRFVLVTAACHYVLKFIGCSGRDKLSLSLVILFWIIFYIFYFNAMTGR